MADLEYFFALRTGTAPFLDGSPDSDTDAELTVEDIGGLAVLSGWIAAGDADLLGHVPVGPQAGRPGAGRIPKFGPVPRGRHQVLLTVAASTRTRGHVRPAYLSIVFTDSAADALEPWVARGGDSENGGPADSFAPAENILGLTDAGAAARGPALPETFGSKSLTACEEHAVYCRTGPGAFPVMATKTATGSVTGLHVDFGVVGPRGRKAWWKARHTH